MVTDNVTPRLSVLIVSFNTRDLVLEAVESASNLPDSEVIVVDNASSDGTVEALAAQFPDALVIRSHVNLGFAGGVNLAASQAHGAELLLLNPDARLDTEAYLALARCLAACPRAAVVGPALRYGDGSSQEAAFALPAMLQTVLDLFPVRRLLRTRLNGRYPTRQQPFMVGHPLGACMLIRRDAWENVGPLDDGFFMYVEEVDWCWRAWQAGWQVWHVPSVYAVHHGAQSTRQRREAMFLQLWLSRLRYFERTRGFGFNRVIHAVIRRGLNKSSADRAVQLSR